MTDTDSGDQPRLYAASSGRPRYNPQLAGSDGPESKSVAYIGSTHYVRTGLITAVVAVVNLFSAKDLVSPWAAVWWAGIVFGAISLVYAAVLWRREERARVELIRADRVRRGLRP